MIRDMLVSCVVCCEQATRAVGVDIREVGFD